MVARWGRRSVKLSKDELQRVARLVREADLATVKVPKSDGGTDTYAYTFRYRGRTLRSSPICQSSGSMSVIGVPPTPS